MAKRRGKRPQGHPARIAAQRRARGERPVTAEQRAYLLSQLDTLRDLGMLDYAVDGDVVQFQLAPGLADAVESGTLAGWGRDAA